MVLDRDFYYLAFSSLPRPIIDTVLDYFKDAQQETVTTYLLCLCESSHPQTSFHTSLATNSSHSCTDEIEDAEQFNQDAYYWYLGSEEYSERCLLNNPYLDDLPPPSSPSPFLNTSDRLPTTSPNRHAAIRSDRPSYSTVIKNTAARRISAPPQSDLGFRTEDARDFDYFINGEDLEDIFPHIPSPVVYQAWIESGKNKERAVDLLFLKANDYPVEPCYLEGSSNAVLYETYASVSRSTIDNLLELNQYDVAKTDRELSTMLACYQPKPASALNNSHHTHYCEHKSAFLQTATNKVSPKLQTSGQPNTAHRSPQLSTQQVYQKVRRTANEVKQRALASFAEAGRYYRKGQLATATYYAEEGHRLNKQAKNLHAEAGQAIFEQINRPALATGNLYFIDLHGLHTAEAMQVLKERLSLLQTSACGQQRSASRSTPARNRYPLTVVTGIGRNSPTSFVSTTKNAVLKYLAENKINYFTVNDGCYSVFV